MLTESDAYDANINRSLDIKEIERSIDIFHLSSYILGGCNRELFLSRLRTATSLRDGDGRRCIPALMVRPASRE